MGFFNRTRDFLNGFSFSLKKEYNPFLSAALMYLPNFKINELNDGSKYAELESNDGKYTFKLILSSNNRKIDELHTQIFNFLDNETIKSIESFKSLSEFLSYQEYKNKRNISKTSFDNISKASGQNWLISQYLELKSKRSYVRYLLEPDNKRQIDYYEQLILTRKVNLNFQNHSPAMMLYTDKIDSRYYLDSQFKNLDAIRRSFLTQNVFFKDDNIIIEKEEMKHRNKYKIMDVWYLHLSVLNENSIIFEDVELVNGLGGYELHEDDFLFFEETMNHIFKRWFFYSNNFLK